jgi:YHS domain-containing protein/phenylpyruvate tautomerase PptA (4-oxalocrotonate tautomerase family)
MLLIELFTPRGALDESRRRHVAQRLVTAVMSAPDASGMEEAVQRGRALCHAVVHEPEAWSVGGAPVDPNDPPRYFVRVSLPARHLTDAMRADLVARITRVLAESDQDPDRPYREPAAWVHLIEVPDGNIGAFGRVLRLTDLMGMVLNGERATTDDGPDAATTGAGTEVDPVCGMHVTLTDEALTLEHDGITYAFCSGGCREVFAARIA